MGGIAALGVLAVVMFGAQFGAGSGVASASAAHQGASAGLSAAAVLHAGTGTSQPAAGTNIGPAQINLLRRPGLCWQANGNGAPITLENCDTAIQAQQWTLTSNGVLMNGIGYCLEAGTGPVSGGVPLYVDFAGQCGGSARQIWQFSGTTGELASPRASVCAGVGGQPVPGAEVVRRACAGTATGRRWSFGYSAVTLAAGTGSGRAGGAFTASVTAANAVSAQAAYGVTVRFGLRRGLSVTSLRASAGLVGWTCIRQTLTCSGTLPAGVAGRIDVAGRLPAGARRGRVHAVSARVSVTGTSQVPWVAHATAAVAVAVLAAAPAVTGAGPQGSRPSASSPAGVGLRIVAIIAGVFLLLGGGLLVSVTQRPKAGGHHTSGHHTKGLYR
ncbi:MAG TPA: RICIN domain-containing protein [Streptosporangiaceae bacterium]|nr:RICIN domain-containing protein [Streptosporangiaceae bacterium]